MEVFARDEHNLASADGPDLTEEFVAHALEDVRLAEEVTALQLGRLVAVLNVYDLGAAFRQDVDTISLLLAVVLRYQDLNLFFGLCRRLLAILPFISLPLFYFSVAPRLPHHLSHSAKALLHLLLVKLNAGGVAIDELFLLLLLAWLVFRFLLLLLLQLTLVDFDLLLFGLLV